MLIPNICTTVNKKWLNGQSKSRCSTSCRGLSQSWWKSTQVVFFKALCHHRGLFERLIKIFLFCVYNCSQNQRCPLDCQPHLRTTKHRGLWRQLDGQESLHMLWVLVITVWLGVASWLCTSLSWKTHYGTDPQNERYIYCNHGICFKLKVTNPSVITAVTEIGVVRWHENEFTTCFVQLSAVTLVTLHSFHRQWPPLYVICC